MAKRRIKAKDKRAKGERAYGVVVHVLVGDELAFLDRHGGEQAIAGNLAVAHHDARVKVITLAERLEPRFEPRERNG